LRLRWLCVDNHLVPDLKTAILCSGVALGVYIPGLYIHRDLKSIGKVSEVFVLETLLTVEKQSRIKDHKKAFHEHFRVALAGQKIPVDICQSIDQDKFAALYRYWNVNGYDYFILLSGFWLPLVEQYKKSIPSIKIECLHIDSTVSPSWKNVGLDDQFHSWLLKEDEGRVICQLDIAKMPVIPFVHRNDALLLHGGGWGMGTYQTKIPALLNTSYHLNIVAYYESDMSVYSDQVTYLRILPNWEPWHTNVAGKYGFPKIGNDLLTENPNYPGLFNITRSVKAVVSKPGGSTLHDSLESATPVVFLEGFGMHEEKNAKLWQHLGFGISFSKWEQTGFDVRVLNELHDNLIDVQGSYPKYMDGLMERI